MNWRMDVSLLATGLISLGLTMVQQGRADLLRVFTDNGQGIGGLIAVGSNMIVPVLLLGALVVRFGKRVVTNTWR